MTPWKPDPKLDLVLERVVDVPRELVWAAWTKPEHLVKWFTPAPWTTIDCEIDLRPGGAWHRRMRGPSGAVTVKHGIYREVAVPERLVFTYITEDSTGVVDPETLVTVTLVDLGGGRTRLTLWHTGLETESARDDHRGGWTGALDRFAGFIAAK